MIRDGKGFKDRITLLPDGVKAPLQAHLEKVKALHAQDLANRLGVVYLPDALERR